MANKNHTYLFITKGLKKDHQPNEEGKIKTEILSHESECTILPECEYDYHSKAYQVSFFKNFYTALIQIRIIFPEVGLWGCNFSPLNQRILQMTTPS
jgi:hypothetical protein